MEIRRFALFQRDGANVHACMSTGAASDATGRHADGPPPSGGARRQRIVRERRDYNQWVATQTLEDYALRYTPERARRRPAFRIGHTALGAIAFLACEAIGGAITLEYGAANAIVAIVLVSVLMFAIGLPIMRYSARHGLDIDLLTRGAGFGYMGSTITSLVYASFTFLLLAVEASIMSAALEMLLGIPIAIAHLISSLGVIPIAIYGIRLISRMQVATQALWLVLQATPLLYIALQGDLHLGDWVGYRGLKLEAAGPLLSLMPLGMAASLLLSLFPQIGEQADYLRFLPERSKVGRARWWGAFLLGGPGWVLFGGAKLLIGSLLAWWLVSAGMTAAQASEPTRMYFVVFSGLIDSPLGALLLTVLFVVVCQLKINVTNAYAGSIAWSNFFSRLTHNHPGRVVWLVFNVVLALMLMEMGIIRAIHSVLAIYACFASGWIGALAADLVVNKPLGLSPPGIEFKRAHLYDINPVGTGAMALALVVSVPAHAGYLGEAAQAFAPFLALAVAFGAAPLIAWGTKGRYYIARQADTLEGEGASLRCIICENSFERPDMAWCPIYEGPICSLCCTLETRCRDRCKHNSRFSEQAHALMDRLLPRRVAELAHTRTGHFVALLLAFALLLGVLLSFVYVQYGAAVPHQREVVGRTLAMVYCCLLVVSGVLAWLFVLAKESGHAAQNESERQSQMLMDEIEAHDRTDLALQKAKEVAEAANEAKSRYIVGISHEIRSPLNAIFGYAQLLERGGAVDAHDAVRVIRRSSEHLSDLVDGLLDISKIENGLMRISRDTICLPEFLEQIVDMFRIQASAKGIGFSYHRSAYLPMFVITDQKRLRQILINLLSNAIKYTDEGSASLTVRYRNQIAEFEVADTGRGVPLEEQVLVFEPFQRGSEASVRAVPGTGMGLTITKLLVQMMGGEVTLHSEPGTGSRFLARLMLSTTSAPMRREPAQQKIIGYEGAVVTVLLVDDDPAQLRLLEQVLAPLGFLLFIARDGGSALTLAARQRPDLVLLDISLPDMAGWDVARRIRALDGAQARIVMVSANAHEYAAGGDGQAWHDAFVMKPVDIDVLLESIGSLLRLDWRYASAPPPAVSPEDARRVARPLPRALAGYIEDLYQLGSIGHVRAIEARLRELVKAEPAAEAFAAPLRAMVANFDLKSYMKALQTVRDEMTGSPPE